MCLEEGLYSKAPYNAVLFSVFQLSAAFLYENNIQNSVAVRFIAQNE